MDIIEHLDALLNANGSEAKWSAADVIVGNPPFLGGSKNKTVIARISLPGEPLAK